MHALSQKKSFQTALVISPPVSQWEQIQDIRRFYDSAYMRWMPHINMSFPFVVEQEFDIAFSMLQEALKDFEAFTVELKTLGFFSMEKDCVMWVDPDVKNDELNKLEQAILKIFPFCDDLVKKASKEKEGETAFKPHMTLGRFDEKIIEQKMATFQKTWNPITFTVNELYIIFRNDAENPFFISKTLRLKNSNGVQDTENINKEMRPFARDYYQTNCF